MTCEIFLYVLASVFTNAFYFVLLNRLKGLSYASKGGEITPYGITQVHALDVDDSQVSNRKVCVIDSGYDLGHPDLQTMNINGTDLHPNPGYIGSTAWSEDQSGHGTHVAGTIAAIGNNNFGVQGVVRNGQINLHVVRAFGSDGLGAWKSRMIIAVSNQSNLYSCTNTIHKFCLITIAIRQIGTSMR